MMDTLKIVGKGVLWFCVALTATMMLAIRFHVSLPNDGILLGTGCTLLWAVRILSRMTFTRETMTRGLKRISIAAAIVLVPAIMLGAMGIGNKTSETPEQSHQERMAKAEARFVQRAIVHHAIPPDARGAICDTRDNLIGYVTFENETVIFDGKLAATPATCW